MLGPWHQLQEATVHASLSASARKFDHVFKPRAGRIAGSGEHQGQRG